MLAAGAGRRFGGGKLLAQLRGRPLLEHALAAMAAVRLDRLIVVLGAGAEDIRAGVDLHGADAVECAGWEEGQAASLRAGVAALADMDAAVVALGDQPGLSPAAVTRVLGARGGGAAAVRATYGGRPGHPAVIERSLFPQVAELRGDVGARELLSRVRTTEVPCDGLADPADVDTPDELEVLK